ncbi:MAG: hypothetical protein AB7G12_00855 [Thermoanaerobaculia bacterium]
MVSRGGDTRPEVDFPYYDGRPVAITGAQWWLVMAGVAAGAHIVNDFLMFAISFAASAGAG